MEPHGQISTLLAHPFGTDVTAWVVHVVISLITALPW